ncbi:MAG: hypothetical protein GXP26_09190 [Planctomycetes bacterium]|nr:hypothetical protein [Planctomycetota bacterium]
MQNAKCEMRNANNRRDRTANNRDLTDRRRNTTLRQLPQSAPFPLETGRNPNSPRNAISLVEILVSLFVLLFGLMGVAAIFPVGNHYVVEGEKFDLGSNLSQNAFEELGCRGMLRPEFWWYADQLNAATPGAPMMTAGRFPTNDPGHAFVIDPLGGAETSVIPAERTHFPWFANAGVNSWPGPGPGTLTYPTTTGIPLPTTLWPVRRLTLLQAGGLPFTTQVAETIFRLRDDLVVAQPEEDDRPSIQTWDINNNGTANDTTDDTLLRRQYKGDYTWLATVVPTTPQALAALQPTDPGNAYANYRYDVSVVVFRKRDVTPSLASERLIKAEIESDGNLILFSDTGDAQVDIQNVDAAVEDVRPGNWIALAGVNQVTGAFMMKWYRLLSLDKDTSSIIVPSFGTGSPQQGRFAMLDGPEWPSNSYINLRAIILPGAISVTTQELTMEGGSLRSFE